MSSNEEMNHSYMNLLETLTYMGFISKIKTQNLKNTHSFSKNKDAHWDLDGRNPDDSVK